jgi:hypothetical protein
VWNRMNLVSDDQFVVVDVTQTTHCCQPCPSKFSVSGRHGFSIDTIIQIR